MMKHLYLLLLGVVCLLSTTSALAQTPLAHYDFSGSAKDITTNANHAVVNGAQLTQDRLGFANSAFLFDGEQSSVTAPNSSILNTPQTTLSFWVNVTALPEQGEEFLFSFGGWQERWKVSLPAHGKLIWTTNNTSGISDMDAGDGNELVAGQWTHVAMVHNGTEDKIYINGAVVATKAVAGDMNATTNVLGIGYNPIDDANYFTGALDEVMIFGEGLSDAEVTALYNEQSIAPAVENAIVANYSFSAAGFDDAYGNHAALQDAAIATDRFGYGNSALAFNGTSTEVTAPNSSLLNSATTSIAFWVKLNSLPATGEYFLLSNGGWQERWKISLPDHGKLVFTTNSASGISDMDSGDGNELSAGEWTHIMMVHDGAKDIIYINGALAAEKNVVGDLNATTHPLGIGYNPVDGGNWTDGVIDEVAIFNYALTAGEVNTFYGEQATFPGTATPEVALYSLNGDGHDDSQFGNTAELLSGGTEVANRHGWGANALEGAAVAPNSAALQTDATTVAFWVKANSFPVSGEAYLLSNGGWQERWKISMPNHGKPVWTTHTASCCNDLDSGTPLTLDTWTHLAMVHDATNGKDLIYLNGSLANERDAAGALAKTKYPLGIGHDPIDGGSFFDGAIDDLRIYNEALDATAIAALYAAQNAAPADSDLVAHYAFSGNGNDETAYNNDASTPVLTTDRFGRTNQAAAFDGATEVTAANSTQQNSPLASISFWINLNTLPASGEYFLLSNGGWQERWKISLPSHGKPVFTTNNTSGISDMDSGDGNELPVGEWTHVVMVHDGSKDIIYFNGAQVAEKDVAGDLNSTTHPLGMGYNPIDGGNWLDGSLDEVQLYSIALDGAAVAALYTEQSTPPVITDNEAPDAPLNLAADVVFNNVDLMWLPATDNEAVIAYNVYLDGVLAATTQQTSAYFPLLTPLTTFSFAVTAIDAAGNESLPSSLAVTTGVDETPDITPPTPPVNLMGSPSFSSVLLSWEAATDDTQVAGYYIWLDAVAYDTIGAGNLSILVTGLEPSELYSFEVAAFDLAGNVSELAELTLSTTEPLETAEPGLVAHYPFDGDANDATPYENHGVIGGDPIFENATHPHGGGMNIKFDGMQDSVLAPNAVQLLSDYTSVAFWIRVDEINTAEAEAYIMDFGHWSERWKISLPQHTKIVWTTNSNTAQFPELISDMDSGDGNELVPGFWWYVTMVHDGENDLVYVNGVQANSKPSPGVLNVTAMSLGMGNNPVEGEQYFNGALDNVKIYNRALTAAEIATLYETGSIVVGTNEPNLVGTYIESVYPNPTTDILNVRHELPANQPLLLRTFDAAGRQLDVLRLTPAEVANGQFDLSVSDYPAGIYSLNFVLGGKNLGTVMFNKQ
ncbi:MAG: LamG-like jellyroll fold domain-containing protein [Lewinella sp.]|uniref:LamG-like jellyroll fold domain-containing protein n=1 Tax=Lewinella sp. TaxID=2004506 RepID=UPI003D6A6474